MKGNLNPEVKRYDRLNAPNYVKELSFYIPLAIRDGNVTLS
jgi:hypothetical protein